MKLLESIGEVDEKMEMYFLEEEFPPVEEMKEAIRRQTIAQTFVPVFCGSAYKNKGVQLLLDGVCDYLPSPLDVNHTALDPEKDEEKVELVHERKAPLVALAFKIEENKYGQLTWVKIYQGTLKH